MLINIVPLEIVMYVFICKYGKKINLINGCVVMALCCFVHVVGSFVDIS